MRVAMLLVPNIVCVAPTDCQAGELLRSIQKRQDNLLLLGSTHSRTRVLQKVIKNYDELNDELQEALNEIWSNEVGKLLLCSLCKEIKLDTQRITILWNATLPDGRTNLFCHSNLTIYLDANKFCQYVGYCDGEFSELPETLDAILFHELCHGLHKLQEKNQYKQHKVVSRLCELPNNDPICNLLNNAWNDDEEIYTETGWHINLKNELDFDYLNTNSYMILQAIKNEVPSKEILQRIFHCDFNLWESKYERSFELANINLKKFLIDTKKYLDE